jgi:drug/metabolite transporter (DMT)-like permease
MVVISTFFWGSNFNAGHAVADDVTPLTAAAERFGIALVLFWVLRLFNRAESRLSWGDALILLPLGVVGVFGFNYAFFTALHTTSALNAALIMALSPMIAVLFSMFMLNVRVGPSQYLGMLVAFVGVTLVITGGHFSALKVAAGDGWMLLACCVWSLYSVSAKKFADHIPAIQFARWTVSIGAVSLILRSIAQLNIQTHAILIYMGVCGSVLAYIYWLRGVQFLGPEKSAMGFNLVPVFTLLVNIALGTLPNAAQLFGLVMVLAGVLASSGWRPGQNQAVIS